MVVDARLESSEILKPIRALVRERLLENPAYKALPLEARIAVAHDTVNAIHYIVGGADGQSRPESVSFSGDTPITRALADRPPLPEGDTAGQRFAQSGPVAAQQGSQSFTEMVQRGNFPSFVAGVSDGVFNAI